MQLDVHFMLFAMNCGHRLWWRIECVQFKKSEEELEKAVEDKTGSKDATAAATAVATTEPTGRK